MIRSIFAMAVTLVVGATAATAQPLEPSGRAVHIQVADLNLSQPADAARFKTRVDRAAGQFCSAFGGSLSQQSVCRQAIRTEAVEKLGDPQRQDFRIAEQNGARISWQIASY